MAALSLTLFGPFQARVDGRPVSGLHAGAMRALLAYLAVEAGREQRRGSLAELLWPEQPDAAALSNLRYSLSDLRHALGDTPTPTEKPILIVTRESIRLNPDADCWVDVREFVRLCDGDAASAEDLSERRYLEEAVALYHGPFLQGFALPGSAMFEDWLFWTREQFQRKAIGAFRRLVTLHVQAGDYAAAQGFAQRQVQLEPLDEIAHRQLMHTLALGGERSAALAQYERCRQILAQELRVEPTQETIALVETIRAGGFEHTATLAAPAEIRSPDTSPAPTLTGDAGLPPAFVARDHELEQLDGYLAGALAGHGRVVFVTGDAGSGKTALMQRFMRRALDRHSGLVAATGSCHAIAGIGDPYLPFRDIVQMLSGDVEARRAGNVVSPEHARRLWALLPYSVQALVDQGPDLIDRFVPAGPLLQRVEAAHWPGGRTRSRAYQARLAELARGPRRTDEMSNTAQVDLFEQVVRVLHFLSLQQPLLLILDDLQWVDRSTAGLLFHLGRRLGHSRVLLVGAYRRDEVALGREGERHPLEAVINELTREFGEPAIDLDAASGRAFVDALLDSEPHRLPESFAAALYQHTDGHALFTVEMLRGLQERGDVVRDRDGCWVPGPSLDWKRLPARVEAVIAEHIGRLPHAWQALLAAASVEGEEFTAEVVARLLAAPDDTQPKLKAREAEVGRLLSGPLRDQRLVVPHSLRRQYSRRLSRFRFRHFLFHKYLYDNQDLVARAKAHEAVARALEELYQENPSDVAMQLAWHFEQAGLPLPAARYLLEAGNRAVQLAAHHEALDSYQRGLDQLAAAPDSSERTELEVALELARGLPLFCLYGWTTPQRARAFEHAEAVLGAGSDLLQSAQLLFVQADFCIGRGEFQRALVMGRQLLAMAQSSKHRQINLLAQYHLGLYSFATGDLVQACVSFEEVVHRYQEDADKDQLALGPNDLRLASLNWLAFVWWALGYPSRADDCSQRAVALARAGAQRIHLVVTLACDAHFVLLARMDRDPTAQVAELLALAEEGKLAMFVAWANVLAGCLAAQQGETSEGIARMERGIASWRSLGIVPLAPLFLLLIARTCLDRGVPQEGLRAVADALPPVEQGIGHFPEPELHRLYGELLLQCGADCQTPDCTGSDGKDGQAETYFLKAIEIACCRHALSWELRATVSLARLRQRMRDSELGGDVQAGLQAEDKADEAQRMLAAVYGRFSEGFDTPDLREAAMLLDRLASP